MLKLNNEGWGLSVLISFLCIFMIALILIGIGAVKLGMDSNNPVELKPVSTPKNSDSEKENEDIYLSQTSNYEKQIKEAGKAYTIDTKKDIANGENLVISLKELINYNYLNKLELSGTVCTGYLDLRRENNNDYYNSYINCGNIYTTEGYSSSLDSRF